MLNFKDDKDLGVSMGDFVKLKSGESVKGVLRGEVCEYYQKWVGKTTVVCDKNDPDAGFRFRINLAMPTDDGFAVKIFEQGIVVYRALRELNEEFDLSKTVVKITRRGERKETSYTVIPASDRLNEKQIKQLKALELLGLDPKGSSTTNAGLDSPPPSDLIDDIPF